MPVSLLWFVGSSTGPTVTPCASVLAVHHGHVELLLQLTCTEIAGELATSVIGGFFAIQFQGFPGIHRIHFAPRHRSAKRASWLVAVPCCSGDVFSRRLLGSTKRLRPVPPLNALNALRHENQEGKRVRKFTVCLYINNH